MMIDAHFHLNEDDFKNFLSKYLDFNADNFVAFIDKNDNGENILNVSSKSSQIRMRFNCKKLKKFLLIYLMMIRQKIDNITVHIINNTTRNRKYVSVYCDISKECIKSITDMISAD